MAAAGDGMPTWRRQDAIRTGILRDLLSDEADDIDTAIIGPRPALSGNAPIPVGKIDAKIGEG